MEKEVVVIDQQAIKPHLAYFYQWEEAKPHATYLRQPEGDRWVDYSWQEVGNQARRVAAALRDMDLPRQSHIGLISKNCVHWIICDLAIMMSGHISVPFYPNLSPTQLRQRLEHSECKVLFAGKLDSLEAVREGVPEGISRIALPLCGAKEFIQWEELLAEHEPITDSPIPHPDDIQSIVYTSGTTGTPKGVIKTYSQIASCIPNVMAETNLDKVEGRFFSYLPLNHDAERAIVESVSLINGGTVYFVESIDTFVDNLKDASPTIFMAVPRIWTKFQMGVLEKIPQKRLDLLLSIPILSSFIKKRIRKNLGLDNLYIAISGAAPIAPSLIRWYQKIGINICEGYGMTENCAVCTINPVDEIRVGTVGKPFPGCEIQIDPQSHEILMKADWIMTGYYKNPELTDKTIIDGWIHTGDMGSITPEGYLKITGRIDDMFKTSKGEYIIPVPIERDLQSSHLIEQVCVIGYGQPQPYAFVNLSHDTTHRMEDDWVDGELTALLAKVNGQLADYEQIHKLVITREEWTVENGLLTPTMKVKRKVLESLYRDKMNMWYDGQHGGVIRE